MQKHILQPETMTQRYVSVSLFVQKFLSRYRLNGNQILSIIKRWNEPHRHYHNFSHLECIVRDIMYDYDYPNEDENEMNLLFMCAIFHDVMYDIGVSDNEQKSADMFKEMCGDAMRNEDVKLVYDAILDTTMDGYFRTPSSEVSAKFQRYDLLGLRNSSIARMIEDEKKIFKEFGAADYELYKQKREEIIVKFAGAINDPNHHLYSEDSVIDQYLEWFRTRTPRIGVYAGTFYPMHNGHIDIIAKAEKVFDKVIIALGVNPLKPDENYKRKKYMNEFIRRQLPNYQVEMFKTTLVNYVRSKKYPVTVIKGLRNQQDFDNEKTQLRFMEDQFPAINVMYIACDRKFEHVSSSAIRALRTFGEDAEKYTDHVEQTKYEL